MPRFRKARKAELALLASVRRKWHRRLKGYRIGLLFASGLKTWEGEEAHAVAEVASDTAGARYLTGLDAWIVVCEADWNARDKAWRRYLLDHEAKHLEPREGGGLKQVGHGVEDWEDVLARHDSQVTGLAITNGGTMR